MSPSLKSKHRQPRCADKKEEKVSHLGALAEVSEQLAATRSRKQKTELLAGCLRALAPDEVAPAVAYLSGELPTGKIGVGPAAVRKLQVEPAGAASLTVGQVQQAFEGIKAQAGAGSKRERQRLLGELYGQATAAEQRFLGQLLAGGLRQGALEGVLSAAVAEAAGVAPAAVRRAAMLAGELPSVAQAALVEGAEGLARFQLTLFRAVKPMLAGTAESCGDALERLGTARLEWKLDGARIQVHRQGDDVRVFSRGLDDVTRSVPEVVEAVRALPARELILDGEVLALRPDGTPQPFQATMRRFGRKRGVEGLREQLPLTPFFFDCLYLNGEGLLDEPGARRFEALAACAGAHAIPTLETSDAAAAEEFYERALAAGHEGVVAKNLEAAYEAGRRGVGWLKLKPAHTLDLVVVAAEWGSGRREGFLSNLHLAARGADGEPCMLGKTFKGLTDRLLAWQTEQLLARETERDGHVVRVRPELVVEVAVGDVQASPHYPAGLALRFARVRRYREDKAADQASTVAEVRALHRG
jgi:DNA ligase-1